MLEPSLYMRRHTVLNVSCRVRLSSVKVKTNDICVQGFDAVVWVTGRASGF